MKINLRESLNKIDLATDNKYDLLNTFDSKKLSDENKKKLAEAIENNSMASVNRILHESEEQLYKVVISSGATKRNFESALYEDEAEGIVDYYGGRWIDENGFEWNMYVEEDDESTERVYPFDESLNEAIDISDYEELHYPLRDGDKYYQLYRKIENGKGVWAAAELDKYGSDVVGEPFKITYEQARGFEPIEDSSIRKLSRDLGKKLLPKRENLNEDYRPLAIGYMILKKEIPNHVNYAEFANYDEVVTAIPSEGDVVVCPRGGKISGTDIAYWQFDAIDLEGKKTKANFSTYIYSLKDFLNNDEMELKLIPDFKLIDEYPYLIEVDDNIDENMQESLNESSEPTEEDWNDFYKLEEDFANIMHSLNSDLDDAQANFYHDDFDGSIKITYRFVGVIENKNSKKTLNKIEKALESYLEKSKFSQYIEIDIYPMDSEILPPGIKNYEIMIKAETEPTKDPWKNESLKSCDTLEYDDKAKDKFGKSFDVADPQEVANTMKKYVKHNGKIYKPESLKEAIDDEIDLDYETDFDDDDGVEEGNVFVEGGVEYVWIERIAGPIYLDFDKWAVWSARVFVDPRDFMTIHSDGKNYDFDGDAFKEKAMAAPIVYFVVEEDTGFIDWGPVESRIEAQDFLNGKQEDWENDMDESLNEDKELKEYYTVNLHYEDIGDGREYDYEADYDDVLEYLIEYCVDDDNAPEDTQEYMEWVVTNFDYLFKKYEYDLLKHFYEDASQEEYDERHSSYEPEYDPMD